MGINKSVLQALLKFISASEKPSHPFTQYLFTTVGCFTITTHCCTVPLYCTTFLLPSSFEMIPITLSQKLTLSFGNICQPLIFIYNDFIEIKELIMKVLKNKNCMVLLFFLFYTKCHIQCIFLAIISRIKHRGKLKASISSNLKLSRIVFKANSLRDCLL